MTTVNPTNASLLFSQAQAGHSLARKSLVERFSPFLSRLAAKLLPAELAGEISVSELVQKTFSHVLRAEDSSAESSAALLLQLRKTLLGTVEEFAAGKAFENPIEKAVGRAAWSRYLEHIAKLAETEQAFLVLLVEGGLEFEDAATLLDYSSADEVRAQVAQALGALTESGGRS